MGAKPITAMAGTPPKRLTIQVWDSMDAGSLFLFQHRSVTEIDVTNPEAYGAEFEYTPLPSGTRTLPPSVGAVDGQPSLPVRRRSSTKGRWVVSKQTSNKFSPEVSFPRGATGAGSRT